MLISLNSRYNLSTFAMKCTSLNLSLTGCFGPNGKTSRRILGSSASSKVSTLLRNPIRKGLSCPTEGFPKHVFLSHTDQFGMISHFFLMLYTIKCISCVFISFLRKSLSSPSSTSNNLRPCSTRLIFLLELKLKAVHRLF